jgi:hypothetical protein
MPNVLCWPIKFGRFESLLIPSVAREYLQDVLDLTDVDLVSSDKKRRGP